MRINKSVLRKSQITDFINLSTSELLKVTRQIAKVVNPMINRLAKYEGTGKIAMDAYDKVNKEGGLINVVGTNTLIKTRNELLKEVNRALYFMHRDTSTVTGARRVQKQRQSIIDDEIDTSGMSQDDIDKLVSEEWDKFHKFIEEHQYIPYSKAVEIYQTSNTLPETLESKVTDYKQQREQEEQDLWKQVSEKTGFQPKWEFPFG